MIFAWLILAHDAPEQLVALLARLLDDNDDFAVLHIDRRSPLWPEQARAIAARVGGRIILIDRPRAVRWAHWSQLGATRAMLDAALNRCFDVAHLISGRDWPAVPRDVIATEIAGAPELCRIETTGTGQQERMQHWWFHAGLLNPRIEGSAAYRATRKILRIASRWASSRVQRHYSYGAPWHKGSQWWSLPRDACMRVAFELAMLERSGRLRFTACSDEHAIQTLCARVYGDRLGDTRRYADWSEGNSSPKTLLREDACAVARSGAWIMRKVDARCDDWFADIPPDGLSVLCERDR